MLVKEISLKMYGDNLGPRIFGQQIKEEVIGLLKHDGVEKIIFDFNEVRQISTGFAKELFGELWLLYPNEFQTKFNFRFGDNREIFISLVSRALKSVQSPN